MLHSAAQVVHSPIRRYKSPHHHSGPQSQCPSDQLNQSPTASGTQRHSGNDSQGLRSADVNRHSRLLRKMYETGEIDHSNQVEYRPCRIIPPSRNELAAGWGAFRPVLDRVGEPVERSPEKDPDEVGYEEGGEKAQYQNRGIDCSGSEEGDKISSIGRRHCRCRWSFSSEVECQAARLSCAGLVDRDASLSTSSRYASKLN